MPAWTDHIAEHEKRVYSQAGQDGAIEYIFGQVGTVNEPPFFIECGYNSRNRYGGSGPNTAALFEKGWRGVLFDETHHNQAIHLHKARLTPENIGDVFRSRHVPQRPDFVSIDVDSIDLWLMEAMLREGFRPRLLCVEYNSHIPFDMAITCPPTIGSWVGDRIYGASLKALVLAGKAYRYSLVHVITGLDAFFVQDELLGGAAVRPLQDFAEAVAVTHLPASDKRKKSVMDYELWLETRDMAAATAAAERAHRYL